MKKNIEFENKRLDKLVSGFHFQIGEAYSVIDSSCGDYTMSELQPAKESKKSSGIYAAGLWGRGKVKLDKVCNSYLVIESTYSVTHDCSNNYLKVRHSTIKVFREGDSQELLFHYDYVGDDYLDDNQQIPVAHYNVPSLENMKGKFVHLPLGGTRFRPILEDIIQALSYDFGFKVDSEKIEKLRKEWRIIQLKAAMRDYPDVAIKHAKELELKFKEYRDHVTEKRLTEL